MIMQVKNLTLNQTHQKCSVNVSYYYYCICLQSSSFSTHGAFLRKELARSLFVTQETPALRSSSSQKQNEGKCSVVILIPNDTLQDCEILSGSVKKGHTEAIIR